MAESQLGILDDCHVNEKVPEWRPEFYYSEEQRAAIEQLLRHGDGAFKMQLRDDNAKDFLSAREVKTIRDTLQPYAADGDDSSCGSPTHSGLPSTYWPQLSDTEPPPLDIGWADGAIYRGATRVSVHTHPPKDRGPHIKEVARRMIQESSKVIAVVMDLLTDLHILQDLLDAIVKRSVSVYVILEVRGVPHFLDMCSRLQVMAPHLRGMRLRSVQGCGLALSLGRLPGSLGSKYMLVDGEKVMFGSYSFTWSCSRLDRNVVTVLTGQTVDVFDTDFRELYAVSQQVDLYKEFHMAKPAVPVPVWPALDHRVPPTMPASRFQQESGQARLKVPAHKYHNPKYSLVVGNSLGLAVSLQDLTMIREALGTEETCPDLQEVNHQNHDRFTPGVDSSGTAPASGIRAMRSHASFRNFPKGRSANQNGVAEGEDTPNPSNPSPDTDAPDSADSEELEEDGFKVIFSEMPAQLKGKLRKPSKLNQRSVSLQAVNVVDEGFKGRRRHSKKPCIQS
ncbi:protein FAM83F [Paramormyrops kingsleyae]|uniref:Family with sequence similarity 83 member Fa n=1 Tax=Paramormyrops kingsleyae TaxID=1676925 RepID=A0A3B3RGJ0_9TELE|nr:protein FAM83F-like [Paramormyrops kingsleyae]XP_023666570.1 protein FAM83F-like [Paramormyrops kingsleyae]